jgi:hypothetical protein
MIEPELGRDRKWLPASESLGGWQENLFFHADVAEKPGSKLRIRSLINMVRISHSLLKQRFKPPVVFHKKVFNRPCFSVLSWSHPLPPIMSSSDGEKGRGRSVTRLTSPRADEAVRKVAYRFFPSISNVLEVRPLWSAGRVIHLRQNVKIQILAELRLF